MQTVALMAGIVILFVVLGDTFESLVLPRTVTRRLRLARYFYIVTWRSWKALVRRFPAGVRERYLGAYGPMSLILLLGFWALCLILSFALMQWGLGAQVHFNTTGEKPTFGGLLYMSGTTFFTLGFGDVTPSTGRARFVSVLEAGVGFGFLAIVIGYLPVLYQSFSRREVGISRLDARAGSPPTAGELLRRHAEANCMATLAALLADWEIWASDVLESHLSYPTLAYYRSQHDRESWLAALTAILDACVLVTLRFKDAPEWEEGLIWQAKLTYAMARHAIVDLSLILSATPVAPVPDRLPSEQFVRLCAALEAVGVPLCLDANAEATLRGHRKQYEPYVNALAQRLMLELPPWMSETDEADNWQVSAWDKSSHF